MSSGFDPVRFMEEGMGSGLAPDPFDPRRDQALADLYAQSQDQPPVVPLMMAPEPQRQPPALGQILLRMLSGMQITPGRSASPLARTLAGLGSGVAQATGQTLLHRQSARHVEGQRERIRKEIETKRNFDATALLNKENREFGRESASTLRKHQLDMVREAANRKPPETGAQIEADAYHRTRGSERARTESGGAEGGIGVEELTPEAMGVMARLFVTRGTYPSFGMGKSGAAARVKFLNFVGTNYPEAQVAANAAQYAADKAALVQLQKNRDAVHAFSETARRNADVLEQTMQHIPDSGNMFVNHWVRGAARVLGNENVTNFNTALQTIQPEFARILNNPNLVGQLTDSARKELQAVLSGDYTKKQLRGALTILRTDAGNREGATEQGLVEIQTRLQNSEAGITAPPVTTSTTKRYFYDSAGNRVQQ